MKSLALVVLVLGMATLLLIWNGPRPGVVVDLNEREGFVGLVGQATYYPPRLAVAVRPIDGGRIVAFYLKPGTAVATGDTVMIPWHVR